MEKIEEYQLKEKISDCVHAFGNFIFLTELLAGVFLVAYWQEKNPDSVFLGILIFLIVIFSLGWVGVLIAWLVSGAEFLYSLIQIIFYFIEKKRSQK
jgi:hypothetical protein